ncbi:MAG: cold shock domain-containing protein [Bryobacteraceae bacterium]|jgi:cold shock CspA family protein
MQGRVRYWNQTKLFGFITTEAGDFFFHESGLIGEVERGDEVSFWLDDDPRGKSDLIAVEVQRIEAAVVSESINENRQVHR